MSKFMSFYENELDIISITNRYVGNKESKKDVTEFSVVTNKDI